MGNPRLALFAIPAQVVSFSGSSTKNATIRNSVMRNSALSDTSPFPKRRHRNVHIQEVAHCVRWNALQEVHSSSFDCARNCVAGVHTVTGCTNTAAGKHRPAVEHDC